MNEKDIPANPVAVPDSGTVDYTALGQAAAKLVHDFKNQLGGLKLYASFLKTRLAHDPESADIVGKILQGLDGMAENATLVSQFSRPVELRCTSGNWGAMVNKVLRNLAPQAAERQVQLTADYAITLPDVPFDEQQLEFALAAVVKRAVAVAPAQTTVRIVLEQQDQTITFSVSDAGEPLSEQAREQFFHWMTQERLQKTALELAHAARIVAAHGGEASVSQTDELTLVQFTFKFDLPPQEQHA